MGGCCSFTVVVEQTMIWGGLSNLLEIGYSEGIHLVTTKLLCTGTLQTSLKEEMLTVEVNMLYRKLKRKMKSPGAKRGLKL